MAYMVEMGAITDAQIRVFVETVDAVRSIAGRPCNEATLASEPVVDMGRGCFRKDAQGAREEG